MRSRLCVAAAALLLVAVVACAYADGDVKVEQVTTGSDEQPVAASAPAEPAAAEDAGAAAPAAAANAAAEDVASAEEAPAPAPAPQAERPHWQSEAERIRAEVQERIRSIQEEHQRVRREIDDMLEQRRREHEERMKEFRKQFDNDASDKYGPGVMDPDVHRTATADDFGTLRRNSMKRGGRGANIDMRDSYVDDEDAVFISGMDDEKNGGSGRRGGNGRRVTRRAGRGADDFAKRARRPPRRAREYDDEDGLDD